LTHLAQCSGGTRGRTEDEAGAALGLGRTGRPLPGELAATEPSKGGLSRAVSPSPDFAFAGWTPVGFAGYASATSPDCLFGEIGRKLARLLAHGRERPARPLRPTTAGGGRAKIRPLSGSDEISQDDARELRRVLKEIASYYNPAVDQADRGQAAARLARETLDRLGLLYERLQDRREQSPGT
jgi:hypothetical protein